MVKSYEKNIYGKRPMNIGAFHVTPLSPDGIWAMYMSNLMKSI